MIACGYFHWNSLYFLDSYTKRSDSEIKADKSRTVAQYGAMKINILVWCWPLAGNAKPECDKHSASVNFHKRIDEANGKA
jgi:hypothetical protein